MAKPRKKNQAATQPARDTVATVEASRPTPAAGKDLPHLRDVAIAGIVLLLLGVVLLYAAEANALLWLKQAIALLAGMPDPTRLPHDASSWDIAVTLWCLVAGITASVLHPALGLAAIMLLRTWVDAMTFPTESTLFTWLILLLAVLCCARMITRGMPIRAVGLSALLTGFLAVCLLTTITAVELGPAYQGLMAWLTHVLVFLIVVNTLGGHFSRRMLFAVFAVVVAAQALYAITTYTYLLPVLRSIARNPAVLREFFGTDTLTPEIADRLNKNRAFGSMLFPNALASFLVLAIPALAAGALRAWRERRAGLPGVTGTRNARVYSAVAAFIGAWFAVGGGAYQLMQFAVSYHQSMGTRAWYAVGAMPGILSAALGLAAALWLAYQLHQYGPARTGANLAAWGLPLALLLAAVALVLTWSRGAMLSLAVALVVTALLARVRMSPRAATAAAVALLLICGTLAGHGLSGTHAAAQGPAPDGATLVEAGENVSGRDLLNPHTLLLRFAYWGVGWRMFLDHPLTGVGLGCFGAAYPVYQQVGEPPVREAHSSLQVFCETGLFGGVLFYAFWGAFFLWGLRRVRAERDRGLRLTLAGLYGSLLAFFLHAGIDISFSHAGLCFFAFLLAGLFVVTARGGEEDPPPVRHPRARMAVLAATLCVAVVAFGVSARAYSQDISLSRMTLYRIDGRAENEIRQRLSAMDFYAVQRNRDPGAKTPRQALLRHILDLGITMDEAFHEGVLYVPVEGGRKGLRRLRPGEAVPEDTAVLDIRHPQVAYRHAIGAMERWLAAMERVDGRFPRSTDLAIAIMRGYRMLADNLIEADLAEARQRFLERYLAWAEECTRRNPMNSDLQNQLARAWILKAQVDTEQRAAAWEAAVDAARQAVELAPAYAEGYGFLAWCHRELAAVYTAAGQAEDAAQQEQAATTAEARQQEIWDAQASG